MGGAWKRGKEARLESGKGKLHSVVIRALTVSVSYRRSETTGESPGASSHCQPEKRPVQTQLCVLPASKESQARCPKEGRVTGTLGVGGGGRCFLTKITGGMPEWLSGLSN